MIGYLFLVAVPRFVHSIHKRASLSVKLTVENILMVKSFLVSDRRSKQSLIGALAFMELNEEICPIVYLSLVAFFP